MVKKRLVETLTKIMIANFIFLKKNTLAAHFDFYIVLDVEI